jgi:hypothetical protein
MASVTFFRQQRVDGGIRTGIDFEGITLLESFTPGGDEDDPVLLWYVDVQLEGVIPVRSPEHLRRWLSELTGTLQPFLDRVADEMDAGADGEWPVRRSFDLNAGDLRLTVSATGVRRLAARQLGERVREIGQRWREFVEALHPLSSAA